MKKLLLTITSLISLYFVSSSKSRRKEEDQSSASELANDVINNLSKARILYKDLIRKAHPDNFPLDENLRQKVQEIASSITQNKKNYAALKELEIELAAVLPK